MVKHYNIIMLFLIGAFFALTSATLGFAGQDGQENTSGDSDEPSVVTTLENLVGKSSHRGPLEGMATYYAKRFEGRKTASGHRYNSEKMTAAHYTLPLGTVVRVVNPATQQEVHVTINDRCARRSFNLIDLSRAAAKKIGLLEKGIMKVIIIPLLERPI